MRRVLLFGLAVLAVFSVWLLVSLYLPYQGFPAQGVYVDIPRGASQRTIARLLATNGVLRDRLVFEGLSRWRGRTLEAGEYFFDQPATAFAVYDALANGRVYVRELIVPEGYSMFDIADLAEHEGFTTRDDFLAAARDPAPIRDLAPGAPSLDGFLFPATYEFPRHPSGAAMVAAMVRRFRAEWTTLSSSAASSASDAPASVSSAPDARGNSESISRQSSPQSVSPALSLTQVVTLASLVERETPKADERPLVAGVFANRLRSHLPLQCDPTVVYALELAGQYSGALGADSLPFPSPYNTYRHTGLPPGPIANPGDASLRAALHPQRTDYLYFVANTEGGHFFSKTLEEHNRNVALYRRRLAAQRSAGSASEHMSLRAPGAGDSSGLAPAGATTASPAGSPRRSP